MQVIEYLRKKYSVSKPTTILASEARIFGIPYPLQAGWANSYGETEITPQMVFRLRASLSSKGARKKGYALIGLALIEGMESEAPKGNKVVVQEEPYIHKTKKQLKRERKSQKAKGKPPKSLTPVANVQKFIDKSTIDPRADEFLSSFEWRALRMMALKKLGAKCQCCGATPAQGLMMHVDHIKPRKTHPELALSLDNLQVLCEVCNHGKGNWDDTDWRKTPAEIQAMRQSN